MKKDVKHKCRDCFTVLCFVIPLVLGGNVFAGNSKSLELRNKLRHIQYLREGLSNRHREASELTENLKARMEKFKRWGLLLVHICVPPLRWWEGN